nr:testis-specific serine/threonine-protein kinase 3-like [Lytechinus pictus]
MLKPNCTRTVQNRPQFPTEDDVNSTAKTLKAHGYILEGRPDIKQDCKLGEGTYAKVRRAYSYNERCRVAIKIVSRSRLNAQAQQKFLPRELKIVRTMRHPHIIELLRCSKATESSSSSWSWLAWDLLEYVQKKNALWDSEARTAPQSDLISHRASSFAWCHRDLKCENILLDWGPTGIMAKLTDFGFKREWCEALNPARLSVAVLHMLHQRFFKQFLIRTGQTSGAWGLCLYHGRMPFDDSNIREALEDMHNNRLKFTRRRLICIEVQRLLRAILTYDPRQRPGVKEIRDSPWMRGRSTMAKPSPRISSSVGGV